VRLALLAQQDLKVSRVTRAQPVQLEQLEQPALKDYKA